MGDEPSDTMDSEKQTEGFRMEGAGRWVCPVMDLRKPWIAWSTGCYKQTMNHGILYQKLIMYYVVTNIA